MCKKVKKTNRNELVDMNNIRVNSPTVGGDYYDNREIYYNVDRDDLKEVLEAIFNDRENNQYQQERITPTNRYTEKYKELKGYLFNWVIEGKKEYKPQNKFSIFGKDMIDWLIGEKEFPFEGINDFVDELYNEYNYTNSWRKKRWKAISEYYRGNIEATLRIYEELYRQCEDDNSIIEWIKLDIYIDGRNINLQNDDLQNRIRVKNDKYQEKLTKYDVKVYYPILDRLRINIYEKANKNLFNVRNKSRNTVIYGVGLDVICDDIQEVLYNILMFGSITHLNLLRDLVAEILTLYAEGCNDEILYKRAIRMLLLSGKTKECEKLFHIVKYNNRVIYSIEYIEELNSLKDKFIIYKRNHLLTFIFKLYGRFFSDEQFLNYEKDMLDIVKISEQNTRINLIEEGYEAISYNIDRMKEKEELFKNINIRVKKEEYRFINNIIKILRVTNIELLSDNEKQEYINIVDNCMKLKREYLHNFSAVLSKLHEIQRYKKNLKETDTIVNIISDIELNINIVEAINFCIDKIKLKYKQREEHPGLFSYGAYSFENIMEVIVDKYYNKEIACVIIEKYIPLAIQILKSDKQVREMKKDNIILLMRIINKDIEIGDKEVYNSLKETIPLLKDDILNGECEREFGREVTKECLNIYLLMLQCMLKIKDIKKVVEEYINYSILSLDFVEDIAYCFDSFVELNKNDITIDIWDKMYYMFLLAINNGDTETRNIYIEYLYVFEGTVYEEKIKNWLIDNSENGTYEEGIQIIKCMYRVKDNKQYEKVIDKLTDSQNYYVKISAHELKRKTNERKLDF